MTREDIIEQIQKIENVNEIEFYQGDVRILNRFDVTDNHLYEEADYTTSLAFTLYSFIVNAIIYKAQGKENCRKGYLYFSTYLDKLVTGLAKDISLDAVTEKNKALVTLDAFLFSKETIMMDKLMATLVPLAYIKVMRDNPEGVKKIAKIFSKDKEVIFNLTLKFIRSLYHIFLTNSDASLIKTDSNDLSNGLFTYGNELVLPSWQSAYTVDTYKDCCIHMVQTASENFGLKDVNTVSLLYLSKDFEAKFKLK